MTKELTSRERVRMAIAHQIPDRVPKFDSPWHSTLARWHEEGLPSNVDHQDYFDYDIRPLGADLSPRLPIKVIAEDEEYVTETNNWGGIRRNHRDRSTTPEIIECPVKSKDDWRKIEKRLYPDYTRVDWVTARAKYQKWRDDGRYIVFSAANGYDATQAVIRSEELLVLMAEDPEWIRDIMLAIAKLISATMELMYEKGLEFDGIWTCNDMGYRNSSLFSPQMYRDIVRPADRVMWGTAERLGMQKILHSCGRVSGLVPDLMDAGMDCLQVLEIKAGMDPIDLKCRYGDRLALFGGIDTRCLEDAAPERIETEIRTKFDACMPGGGYLYHTDHSVPKDVSFEQYRHCLAMVDRYGRY